MKPWTHIPSLALLLLFGVLLLAAQPANAQREEKLLTFGLQLKPIIPLEYLNSGTVNVTESNVDFSLAQQAGYSFGMLLRRNFTKRLSLETGISYVRRNYRLSLTDQDLGFSGSTEFRVIGYEMPTMGLVYIQLGEQTYMNAAFGVSLDLFPSDVASRNREIYTESQRRNWVQISLLSNLGFEYRTRESGIFYLGASFHRPFNDSYNTLLRYENDIRTVDAFTGLNGNYLTIDLRYFFHEEPKKVQPRTKTKEKPKFRDYLPF